MATQPRVTVRVGGCSVGPADEVVVWSVADGRRGRRWRELATSGDGPPRSVLVETDPHGAITRLEMATIAGLLTLRPADEPLAIHGNVVTAAGIRHLAFGAEAGTGLVVEGSPATEAILVGAGPIAGLALEGVGRVPVIWVDERLDPRPAVVEVVRLAERVWSWRLDRAGEGTSGEPARLIRIDSSGLVETADELRWPLAH